jgi:hypothetical protein
VNAGRKVPVKVPIIELHRKGRQVKVSIKLCTGEVRKVKVTINVVVCSLIVQYSGTNALSTGLYARITSQGTRPTRYTNWPKTNKLYGKKVAHHLCKAKYADIDLDRCPG